MCIVISFLYNKYNAWQGNTEKLQGCKGRGMSIARGFNLGRIGAGQSPAVYIAVGQSPHRDANQTYVRYKTEIPWTHKKRSPKWTPLI